ncbi:hypothetical protein BCR34DRAFT_595621 [Clohesyomyces aquaticus]|uniref:Uncharacterized protein n=1 Tax=Clohesyomyces aquaticus TaxID=1231657 RepID=A0A1Y2A9H9_9PLEO|nr:hypothetical protein BCR34DRAFT_595621 [Clohesyomyces aquaticus]
MDEKETIIRSYENEVIKLRRDIADVKWDLENRNAELKKQEATAVNRVFVQTQIESKTRPIIGTTPSRSNVASPQGTLAGPQTTPTISTSAQTQHDAPEPVPHSATSTRPQSGVLGCSGGDLTNKHKLRQPLLVLVTAQLKTIANKDAENERKRPTGAAELDSCPLCREKLWSPQHASIRPPELPELTAIKCIQSLRELEEGVAQGCREKDSDSDEHSENKEDDPDLDPDYDYEGDGLAISPCNYKSLVNLHSWGFLEYLRHGNLETVGMKVITGPCSDQAEVARACKRVHGTFSEAHGTFAGLRSCLFPLMKPHFIMEEALSYSLKTYRSGIWLQASTIAE